MNVTVHIPPFKVTGATHVVHRLDTGPVGEMHFQPEAGFQVFRSLADIDAVIGAYVALRAEYGEAEALYAARPLTPLPRRDAEPAWAAPVIASSPGAVMEVTPVTEPPPPDLSGDLLAIPANRISDGSEYEPPGYTGMQEAAPGECGRCLGPAPEGNDLCPACEEAEGADALAVLRAAAVELPPLPHRAPLEAPVGEPTCDEKDGNWACTASPLHAGDHASHGAGNVMHQWQRAPASEDATT